MTRSVALALLTITMLAGASAVLGQSTGDRSAEITIRTWERLQAKILNIARDFPAELFDYQPHPDSRSFAREMWHIIGGNEALAARIRDQPLDPASVNIPPELLHDRQRMVERLSASASACTELLRADFDPRSIQFLEHLAEHYGKLVTLYRINGLVPPESRPDSPE